MEECSVPYNNWDKSGQYKQGCVVFQRLNRAANPKEISRMCESIPSSSSSSSRSSSSSDQVSVNDLGDISDRAEGGGGSLDGERGWDVDVCSGPFLFSETMNWVPVNSLLTVLPLTLKEETFS